MEKSDPVCMPIMCAEEVNEDNGLLITSNSIINFLFLNRGIYTQISVQQNS